MMRRPSAEQVDQRTPALMLAPSVEAAAFVIVAIRQHAERFRVNGAPVPREVWQIEALLASGVTQGQPGSPVATGLQTEQIEVMTPRLVTYDTAAKLLAVSLATLKRRIKAGDFHPIDLGGGPRIRVAEIDQRIAEQVAACEQKGA